MNFTDSEFCKASNKVDSFIPVEMHRRPSSDGVLMGGKKDLLLVV